MFMSEHCRLLTPTLTPEPVARTVDIAPSDFSAGGTSRSLVDKPFREGLVERETESRTYFATTTDEHSSSPFWPPLRVCRRSAGPTTVDSFRQVPHLDGERSTVF